MKLVPCIPWGIYMLAGHSGAHIKSGNPDAQEIPPSGVILSRDIQHRPHVFLASSPAAPTGKAVFGLVS